MKIVCVLDFIVSLCDNWPPPPCSQLQRSLQCCSLLNYYQWVWRDTCSLFPLTISFKTVSPTLSLSLSPSLTHMYTDTRPIFHLTRICRMLCKNGQDLYCASVSRAGRCFHVNIYAWWEIHSNTGTDLHTVMHECTREQAHRNTDASL